ncbi:hypothetical protein Nepgr_007127 [Nepenthes gracilis]|uniref:Stigma-specific Stig1 family protein n=1 Tax=Nepenthes gracilis TaxID=150966 RepID=A0AAD3S699_NEPGR|nr:hypothetical protein Nepgr_007127 [Nepenthes gracilis]
MLAMRSPIILFLLLLPAVLAQFGKSQQEEDEKYDDQTTVYSTGKDFLIRDTENYADSQSRLRFSCSELPSICRSWSPGPDCCNNNCVDLMKDQNNCGQCTHKCRINEICCGGSCINPWKDPKHCGGCNNRCPTGVLCVFRLCGYA